MSESETDDADHDPVEGFDPAQDRAGRQRWKAQCIRLYERLLAKGEEAAAEELRRASRGELLQRTGEAQTFDPEYDDPGPGGGEGKIKRIYDELREAGHDDAAEELRDPTPEAAGIATTSDLTTQSARADDLAIEHDVGLETHRKRHIARQEGSQ